MSATNSNEMEQNTADHKPLNEKQVRAIEMKYEGLNYAEIADEIDTPESTVRKWFAPALDNLHKAYCEYADKQNELRKEVAERKLKALVGDAVDAISELIQSADKDSTRLAAAEGVLERTFGKVTQNINLIGTEQLGQNLDLLKNLAGIKPNADNTAGPSAS